jgi:hypothetical protein
MLDTAKSCTVPRWLVTMPVLEVLVVSVPTITTYELESDTVRRIMAFLVET